MVAVLLNLHLDIPGVRGGDLRLCHEECRADLALHQRLEPCFLLRIVAVLGQHFHVARVGGGAVDGFRGYPRLAEPLGHEAILEVREAGRLLVVALGEEHVPEPQGPRPLLEIINDLGVVVPPGIANTDLGLEDSIGTGVLVRLAVFPESSPTLFGLTGCTLPRQTWQRRRASSMPARSDDAAPASMSFSNLSAQWAETQTRGWVGGAYGDGDLGGHDQWYRGNAQSMSRFR